jgi:uncharacterized protein YbjT (DUF2867 family)
MIAVMGAAGNVGGKLADLLLQGDQEVRVLQHRRTLEELGERGAEVVTGDGLQVEDLRRLFTGADAAFVLLPDNVDDPRFVANRSRMSQAITDALRETRVGHVVALSMVGLRDTDLLVLRPTAYMDYLLGGLPLIRSQWLNGSVIDGDLEYPMIATIDVAQEAAERLTRRDWSGHRGKLLLGPEDVSMREATRAIGSRLGIAELPYVELPPAEMKGALLGAGLSEEAAGLLVAIRWPATAWSTAG